jgi:hypothetical protein
MVWENERILDYGKQCMNEVNVKVFIMIRSYSSIYRSNPEDILNQYYASKRWAGRPTREASV